MRYINNRLKILKGKTMKYSRYVPNDCQINVWFYLFIALIAFVIEYVACDVFKNEEKLNAEEVIAEYSPRCPKGYVAWMTIDYSEPSFVDGAKDSIMMFEKKIRSGCRQSLAESEISDSVHYCEIFGSVNISTKYVVSLDSFSGTEVRREF